jgi:hypothetical protein
MRAAITLDLDEAALLTAGATGSNPLLTTEVDNTPSLSFTAGSDNLVSFGFSTTLTGLVTDLNNDGSQDIWWQRVSATQLKGFLNAGMTELAVTLDLSAPAFIATGATGTVTVTADAVGQPAARYGQWGAALVAGQHPGAGDGHRQRCGHRPGQSDGEGRRSDRGQ